MMESGYRSIMDYRKSSLRYRPNTASLLSSMTSQQRAVLRRKKAYIAESVGDTDELATEIKETGLIDEETVKDLQDEKNPTQLIVHLLEASVTSSVADAYDTLMTLLSRRHQWLVEELRVELMYEMGAEAVDPEVAKDASSLVHKKFGSSKRWGECDKKDILDLLAVKIHLKNEEWQKRIQTTEDQLKVLQNTLNHRENTALEVSRAVRHFIQDHEKILVTHSHGMLTTSDIVTCMNTDSDNKTLTDLQTSLTRLLFRIDQVLNHRETLLTERSKSFRVLKIKDETIRSDKAIADVIATYKNQIKKLKSEIKTLSNSDPQTSGPANESAADDSDVLDLLEVKDATIARMRARLTELEKNSFSAATQITDLRYELDHTRTEMVSLRRNSRSLEMNIEALKQKARREPSVQFNDSANTVSIVELSSLPAINKKKAPRSAKSSSAGVRKLQRRPSTVH